MPNIFDTISDKIKEAMASPQASKTPTSNTNTTPKVETPKNNVDTRSNALSNAQSQDKIFGFLNNLFKGNNNANKGNSASSTTQTNVRQSNTPNEKNNSQWSLFGSRTDQGNTQTQETPGIKTRNDFASDRAYEDYLLDNRIDTTKGDAFNYLKEKAQSEGTTARFYLEHMRTNRKNAQDVADVRQKLDNGTIDAQWADDINGRFGVVLDENGNEIDSNKYRTDIELVNTTAENINKEIEKNNKAYADGKIDYATMQNNNNRLTNMWNENVANGERLNSYQTLSGFDYYDWAKENGKDVSDFEAYVENFNDSLPERLLTQWAGSWHDTINNHTFATLDTLQRMLGVDIESNGVGGLIHENASKTTENGMRMREYAYAGADQFAKVGMNVVGGLEPMVNEILLGQFFGLILPAGSFINPNNWVSKYPFGKTATGIESFVNRNLGLSAVNQVYQQRIAEGDDNVSATANAITHGLITMGIEGMNAGELNPVSLLIGNGGFKWASGMALIQKANPEMILQVMGMAFEEGSEEVYETLLDRFADDAQNFVAKGLTGESLAVSNPTDVNLEDMASDFAIGALGSVLMSATTPNVNQNVLVQAVKTKKSYNAIMRAREHMMSVINSDISAPQEKQLAKKAIEVIDYATANFKERSKLAEAVDLQQDEVAPMPTYDEMMENLTNALHSDIKERLESAQKTLEYAENVRSQLQDTLLDRGYIWSAENFANMDPKRRNEYLALGKDLIDSGRKVMFAEMEDGINGYDDRKNNMTVINTNQSKTIDADLLADLDDVAFGDGVNKMVDALSKIKDIQKELNDRQTQLNQILSDAERSGTEPNANVVDALNSKIEGLKGEINALSPDANSIFTETGADWGAISTAVHEITHFAERSGNWTNLKNLVKSEMGEERFNKLVERIETVYNALGHSNVSGEHEAVAYYIQKNYGNSEFLQKLSSYNSSTIGRFLSNLKAKFSDDPRAMIENTFMRAFYDAQNSAELAGTPSYSIGSLFQAVDMTVEKETEHSFVAIDKNGNKVRRLSEDDVRNTPLGRMIEESAKNGFTKDADGQIKLMTDICNQILSTQDADLVWAISGSIGYSPARVGQSTYDEANKRTFTSFTTNSDKQYGHTFDVTTICTKTQQLINVASDVMKRLGRGLTDKEIIDIVYKEVYESGQPVPCPVCYVFSRWVGLGGVLDNIKNFQEKYRNADLDELKKRYEVLSKKVDEITEARGITGTKAREELRKDTDAVVQRQYNSLYSKNVVEMMGGEKMSATERAEFESLKKDLEVLDDWSWITNALLDVSTKKGVTTIKLNQKYLENGEVPLDILFDLNRGEDFAKYSAWKYRTTRGTPYGKTITPYTDMVLGQTVLGFASPSKIKELGNFRSDKTNPLLKDKVTKAELNKYKKAIENAKIQNLKGGSRAQSTSDFRFEYVTDYLLHFLQLQSIGSYGQTYTKVPEAVPMLASVGFGTNMSLMPKGKGYVEAKEGDPYAYYVSGFDGVKDGWYTLDCSSVTGIDPKEAFYLREQFDDAQTIMVGVNDVHNYLSRLDPRVDFIIAYHASGGKVDNYQSMMKTVSEDVNEADRDNYESTQTDSRVKTPTVAQEEAYALREKILSGKAENLSEREASVRDNSKYLSDLWSRFYEEGVDENCYHVFSNSLTEQIYPYEFWDTISTRETADVNGQRFIEYCNELGIVPRFSNFLDVDANGNFQNVEGYWKYLIDRPMYKVDGSYNQPKVVSLDNFKTDFLYKGKMREGLVQPPVYNEDGSVKDWGGASKDFDLNKTGEISDRIMEKYFADDNRQYSLGERSDEGISDTDYLKAVEDNDIETAQRMVDEQAKKNGYDTAYIYWRGDSAPYTELKTGAELDEEFSDDHGNLGDGLYFTPDRQYAERFARNGVLRKFYLKSNMADLENADTRSILYAIKKEIEDETGYFSQDELYDRLMDATNTNGIKARGVGGLSYGAPEAVVKESWQAKLADPITYDDNGNIIPLSQRFNENNPDIRYSLGERKSPSEISRVYDKAVRNGNEQVAQEAVNIEAKRNGFSTEQFYHASASEFNEFDKNKIRADETDADYNGFWVSSDPDTLPAWVRKKKTYPLYINYGKIAPADVIKKVQSELRNEWYDPNNKLHEEARSFQDEVRYRLQDMGYNSIIHDDVVDINYDELAKTGSTEFTDVRGRRYLLEKGSEEYGDPDDYYLYYWSDSQGQWMWTQNTYTSPEELNEYTFGPKVVVLFEPNQLKSSAPIEYDDNGNIIPLSERFNQNTNDLRFSLGERSYRRIADTGNVDVDAIMNDIIDSMSEEEFRNFMDTGEFEYATSEQVEDDPEVQDEGLWVKEPEGDYIKIDDSYTSNGKKVAWKDERIDALIEENEKGDFAFSGHDPYQYHYAIELSPKEYEALSYLFNPGQNEVWRNDIATQPENYGNGEVDFGRLGGTNNSTDPYRYKRKNGYMFFDASYEGGALKIKGQEGNHRALILGNSGYESMPVILGTDTKLRGPIQLKGMNALDIKNPNVKFFSSGDYIELKSENRDRLIQKFGSGAHADVQYALGEKKTNGKYFDHGMNPEREVDILKETEAGRTSRFWNNLANSKYASDEEATRIQKMVEDGLGSYEQTSRKKQNKEAEKMLKKMGMEKAFKYMMDTEKMSTMDVDNALGRALLNEMRVNGLESTENYHQLESRMQWRATMQGQALEAWKGFRDSTPEGQIITIRSEVERIQDGLKERWGDKAPNLKLNEDLIERYLSATDDTTREKLREEIATDIAEQIPPSVMEQLNSFRHLSMLFNPRTWIKNRLANEMFGYINETTRAVRSVIETIYSKSHKEFERQAGTYNPLSATDKANYKKAISDYNSHFGKDAETKYSTIDAGNILLDTEFGKEVSKRRKTFSAEWLNEINKFGGKMLSDYPGMSKAYAKTLVGYMKAQNITFESATEEQMEKAREFAYKEARHATFNLDNQLAKAIINYERYGDKHFGKVGSKVNRIIVESFLPFKRTPLNILKTGFDYTPVGLAKTMTYDLYRLKKNQITANTFIDNLAQGLTGTGIALLGALLARLGIFRTKDDDKDRKKYFDSDNGEQDYSINWDGGSYTIDWADPMIIPLCVGAEASKLLDDGLQFDDFYKLCTAMAEPLFETTMLSGITGNLKSYANDSTGYTTNILAKAGTNYLSQYIPSVLGALARTVDDTRRSTTVNNGLIDKFVKTTMNKIPGLSRLNEPYINREGQVQKNEDLGIGIAGRAVLNFLSPGYYASKKIDEYDDEMYRLYQSTGSLDALPSSTSKSVSLDGEDMKFTPKEYTEWHKKRWQTETEYVNDFIDSPIYQTLTDEDRVKTIDDIRGYAQKVAKKQFLESKGYTYTDDKELAESNDKYIYDKELTNSQGALDKGINIYNYYDYLNNAGTKQAEKIAYLEQSGLSQEQKEYLFGLAGYKSSYAKAYAKAFGGSYRSKKKSSKKSSRRSGGGRRSSGSKRKSTSKGLSAGGGTVSYGKGRVTSARSGQVASPSNFKQARITNDKFLNAYSSSIGGGGRKNVSTGGSGGQVVCPRCGNRVSNASGTCPVCGARL